MRPVAEAIVDALDVDSRDVREGDRVGMVEAILIDRLGDRAPLVLKPRCKSMHPNHIGVMCDLDDGHVGLHEVYCGIPTRSDRW